MLCLLYNLSQIKSTVQQFRPECSQTNVCNHGVDYGRTVEDRIRAYVCCVCKQPHPLSAIYTAFTGITRVDICTECFTNLSDCDRSKCNYQNCQQYLLDAKKSHRLQHVETKPQAQNQINLVNNCNKTQGELRTKLPEMHDKCFNDPRLCTKVNDAKTISLRDLLLKRSAFSLFPGQKRCISSQESQSINLKRKSIQKDNLMPKKRDKADSMLLEEPNSDREQDAPIVSLAKFAATTAHNIDKSLAPEIGVKHSSDESNSAFLDHNESFIQFEQYFAHLQNYSDRHFLIPYKENDLRKLYRDLAVLGKWPNKRVNPPKIIPKNLFEIGNIDEDKISAHFLEISDEEANILKENCIGTDRRKIDKILDKATRSESTSLPRYQTKKRKSPGKIQRKYIPEEFDALEIVTELIRFFCVDGGKSRACILKLDILKLLPNFYELPLFLDHIKFASFDGIQTKLVRKLKVLLSFALNIRKYIRHNTAKQTYLFSGCSMAEFIAISRHHILRYLKLEGRKRRSFVFYSHAMAMKHKPGLTEKENANLDIILYSAFIIRSIDKVYGFPVSVYVSGRNSFVALTANSAEFTFADLLSINHFSPFGIFSATLLIRIIRYITECRISCNLPGVNYDNWYFLRLERNIAVIKKNDGAIKKYDIQFYNPEAIVKDCIGRYMAIVEQGVHLINTLPNKK